VPWQDRRILVALSGGIACYKVPPLVSHLVQAGAEVEVAMSEAATRFVGPLTFRSLTGRPVVSDLWEAGAHPESPHVASARRAELVIVAPATADLIARLAAGLAGDAPTLIACALPRATPVLLAPAMNAEMWANPIVQRNLATLTETLGYHRVGPETGWQACRTEGAGRMSEPEVILEAAAGLLA